MPIETATFINQLVTSNPAASDGMNGADDHMRLIKGAVKNTFPNLTGAVTATQDDINSLIGGVGTVNDAGVFFKTSGDGFKNTLAGDIDVWIGGQIGATFQRTGGANFLKVKGSLQVDTTITSGAITAPGIAPIGAMIMWPSNTLPPTSEGVWVWANGASYLKTDYPTANARIGDATASTTFTVLNMQEVSPIGRSGMGGATSPGLLTSIATGVKDVLAALFGVDTVTLSSTQMPTHYHSAGIYDPTHAHSYTTLNNNIHQDGTQAADVYTGFGTQSTGAAATGVRVTSSNGLDTTYSAGGGAAHTNIHPVRAVNFIVRLA